MKIKHIAEVFSSIQGEGLFVGQFQVFVRFSQCNLRCLYCDTQNLTSKTISLKNLVKKIRNLSNPKDNCHSVVITGGEPLLHVKYLINLLPTLKKFNYKIYLETNGTLVPNLKKVIKFIDYISMDIKLPMYLNKHKPLWDEHYQFLKVARSHFHHKDRRSLFVKTVIANDVKLSEFRKAVGIISKVNKDIPLVLQPVTPSGKVKNPVKIETIVKLLKAAKRRLSCVLVIPQVHKILGVK